MRAFGLSGSDHRRRLKGVKNRKVWQHWFWVLEDANKGLPQWEAVAYTSLGREIEKMLDGDWALLDR
jgi:hypothetical protein